MARIFLAPRSFEKTYKKNESSILQGVAFNRLAPFLSSDGSRILGAQSVIYAWGNQPGKIGEWRKISPGDWVLFYEKGQFTLAGTVTYKEDNPKLALAIWPANEKGVPWGLTFFFEKLSPINLSLSGLNALTGYKFKALMGFQEITGDYKSRLLQQFGTPEAFLKAHGLDAGADTSIKKYINLPRSISPDLLTAELSTLPEEKPSTNVKKRSGLIDFEERNRRSAEIGDIGEEIVLKFEREALIRAGKPDLAEKVDRVSLADTSAGYDITSYDLSGVEKLIEVKSTIRPKGKQFSFNLSRNELRVAKSSLNYTIYLVFAVESEKPSIYVLGNPEAVKDSLRMEPTQYQVKGAFK